MSRFGNPHRPTGEQQPDIVHAWAVVDVWSSAMVLFGVLEQQLEVAAAEQGGFLATSPSYETYRIRDEQVPLSVLRDLQPEVLDGRPLAAVHAYAVVQQRNTRPALAAAAPIHAP